MHGFQKRRGSAGSGALKVCFTLKVNAQPLCMVSHALDLHWCAVVCAGTTSAVVAAAGVFVALMLELHDGGDILSGGFDGFYTYFASDDVSSASKPANWPAIARCANAICACFGCSTAHKAVWSCAVACRRHARVSWPVGMWPSKGYHALWQTWPGPQQAQPLCIFS